MNAISQITHEWRERIGQAPKTQEQLEAELREVESQFATPQTSISLRLLMEERAEIIAQIRALKAQMKGEV